MTPTERGAGQFGLLVKDLRAVGIPYEPDLSFPCPVRHQSALYVALGHLCKRYQEGSPLGRRVVLALRRVEAIGKRSRFAGWFERTL